MVKCYLRCKELRCPTASVKRLNTTQFNTKINGGFDKKMKKLIFKKLTVKEESSIRGGTTSPSDPISCSSGGSTGGGNCDGGGSPGIGCKTIKVEG